MSRDLPTCVVITPVRDEAAHLPRTAASMTAQEVRPRQWVIVDDGSTDGTRELAAQLASEHDWIELTDAPVREGIRARGAPIVHAFNHGLACVDTRADVIVKMDADLVLPPDYFRRVLEEFAADPAAGVVGGVVVNEVHGRQQPDHRSFKVSGAVKAYRSTCLDEIGGLRPAMGWDGIDEYAARARGWKISLLTDVVVTHFGLRGGKQPWYRARFEEGVANRYMGYLPTFLLVRVLYRMAVETPPLLGGAAIAAGFIYASLTSAPQVDDPQAIAELRAEQRSRMRGLIRRVATRNQRPDALPGAPPA